MLCDFVSVQERTVVWGRQASPEHQGARGVYIVYERRHHRRLPGQRVQKPRLNGVSHMQETGHPGLILLLPGLLQGRVAGTVRERMHSLVALVPRACLCFPVVRLRKVQPCCCV